MKKLMLKITPFAFAKIVKWMDQSKNECGSFGILGDPDDPLLVTDFVMVKQEVTPMTVEFDDESVIEFANMMDDLGLQPRQYMRVWQHCHPCDCPKPSAVDEDTFEKIFNDCNFSIMLILARNRSTYARIKSNTCGIIIEKEIDVVIDYGRDFPSFDVESCINEYKKNVKVKIIEPDTKACDKEWEEHWNSLKYDYRRGHDNFGNKITENDEFIKDVLSRCFVDFNGEKLSINYIDSITGDEFEYIIDSDRFYDVKTGKRMRWSSLPDWAHVVKEYKDIIVQQDFVDSYYAESEGM